MSLICCLWRGTCLCHMSQETKEAKARRVKRTSKLPVGCGPTARRYSVCTSTSFVSLCASITFALPDEK